MKYTKPALTDAQLLARWQAKGLTVPDMSAAERALRFIGYFRLRGYALPLMQAAPGGRVFKPGTSFPDILARYELDRELRRITLGQLERIEVAVRTVISNVMSLQYGPFWYLNVPGQQVLGAVPGPAVRSRLPWAAFWRMWNAKRAALETYSPSTSSKPTPSRNCRRAG